MSEPNLVKAFLDALDAARAQRQPGPPVIASGLCNTTTPGTGAHHHTCWKPCHTDPVHVCICWHRWTEQEQEQP